MKNLKKVSKNKGPARNAYSKANAGGFTLIEILVVIGIIAILAAIVIIAINPARQFAQARNTQRTANVNAILNAVGQRNADNKGVFEGWFDAKTTATAPYDPATDYNKYCGKIPTSSSIDVADADYSDVYNTTTDTFNPSNKLGCLVPSYIPALPQEPTETGADYTIEVVDGRVKVCAPAATTETSLPLENQKPICVTR